jgi:hypothetical protein
MKLWGRIMSSKLLQTLLESAKISKTAPGELSTPKVVDLATPDNHTTGKHTKQLTVRNLGGLPTGAKKVPQVQAPKTRERRSMTENSVVDAIMGFMMKMSGPKFGRQLYDQLKQEEPDLYKRLVDMFTNLISRGHLTDRQQFTALQNKPEAFQLAREIQAWAQDKLPPEFDDWAAKKADKLGIDRPMESLRLPRLKETSLDNPDGKASMPMSKAKDKDEGLKKPAVAKLGPVARGARIGSIGDNKDNPADIGKTRKLPAGYMGGVSAPVAKIREELRALSKSLGGLKLDPSVMRDVFEDEDDEDWDGFDKYTGNQDDDGDKKKKKSAKMGENASGMAVGAGSMPGTAGAGGMRNRSQLFADAPGGRDPDGIDFIPQTVRAYLQVLNPLLDQHGLDWDSLVDQGDAEPIKRAIKTGMTPKEFADGIANHMGMDDMGGRSSTMESDPCWKGYQQIGNKMKRGKSVPNCVPESTGKKSPVGRGNTRQSTKEASGYDAYPGHRPAVTRQPKSYRDLVNMVYDRMKDPSNTLPENQIIAAVAKEYAGQFGPYQFTFDHLTGLIRGDRVVNNHGVHEADQQDDGHMIQKYADYKAALIKRGLKYTGPNSGQNDYLLPYRWRNDENSEVIEIKVVDTYPIENGEAREWYIIQPQVVRGNGRGLGNLLRKLESASVPKTEDAHDMMPRKTQQIDRGKAMGFKDADEILDPASIPYGDDPGDPRGNPTNEGFGDMIQSVLARMFGPQFAVKKDPTSDWSTISAKGSPDVFKVRTDRAGTVVEWTYQNTKTRAQERGRTRAQLSTFMSSLKGNSTTTASRYR